VYVLLVLVPVVLVLVAPLPPTQGDEPLEYIAAHKVVYLLANAANALIATTNAVSWVRILTAAGILLLSAIMREEAFFGAVVEPSGWSPGPQGSCPRRCGR
jgi:hypothetical protein